MASTARACPSKYVRSRGIAQGLTICQAASDKIVREIELFGEDFSGFSAQEEAVHPHPHPAPTATEDDPDRATTQGTTAAPATDAAATKESEGARVDKAKKGKVAAKSTGLQYQFQIMESIGVPREEIKKFADPYYWLEYFPPICMVRLSNLFVTARSSRQ